MRLLPAATRFDALLVSGYGGVSSVGSECWVWSGSLNRGGYGLFTVRGTDRVLAHVYAYTHHVGPVPPGLVLDHLCRNRACVNPRHLEAVTNRVNSLRGMHPNVVAHRAGVCRAGHPSVGECKTCRAERQRVRNSAPEARERHRVLEAARRARDPEAHRNYMAAFRAKRKECGS